MKKIATLSAEDVMRSWIRAEMKSSRFKKNIRSSLNLSNLESLNFRQLKSVLSSYRKDLSFFQWKSVKWSMFEAKAIDISELRTTEGYWIAFSGGSRSVKDAADFIKTLKPDDDPRVVSESILKSINNDSEELEPIISIKLSAVEPVIIEGHARSIAYYWYSETNPNHKIKLIVGKPSDEFPEDFSSRGYNMREIREYFLNSRR